MSDIFQSNIQQRSAALRPCDKSSTIRTKGEQELLAEAMTIFLLARLLKQKVTDDRFLVRRLRRNAFGPQKPHGDVAELKAYTMWLLNNTLRDVNETLALDLLLLAAVAMSAAENARDKSKRQISVT